MSEINSPKHLKKKLVKDQAAYVETIGKFDNEAFQSVLDAPDGKGTVLRLFLGATSCMPLRALTYVASAARIARTIPCEQVQVISVNKLGEAVNGVPMERSSEQSRLLAAIGSFMLDSAPRRKYSFGATVEEQIASKVIFAEDGNTDHIDQFVPIVEKVLGSNSELALKLSNKGEKHGGDFVTYGAAHLANQDTDLLRLNVIAGKREPIKPKRIVTVGCQQERTFYDLRMAMRQIADPEMLVPSGQVFTNHVSPPYFMSREGEQSLESALAEGVDQTPRIGMSTMRDLRHFNRVLNGIDPTPRALDFCSGVIQ